MTNETETNAKEQKAEDHNGRSDIGTGNIPAIKEIPNRLKKAVDNE